ncbi:ABC transporter substrate-binding protein [Naasia sp. SYSU D00948]|uniref:ABC transporter substrate-binding protein n=1 Tax=Naasia sp. SYSU D00948 TaxID=2817379 RepID=UPI001B30E0CC|nr:ABC transporter substrate-binding protein [Naasia sp. SYSU D00948]
MNSLLSRPRALTRAATAALAVSAVLATAACASSPSNERPGESNGSGGGLGTAELTIAVAAPPASLDPAQLAEGEQAFIWASVFDTLLAVDQENEIQPNAAESYEYSDDLRTLTLTLRDDLTFTNGDPVTAEDVVGTLERTRTTPSPQQPKLAKVSSIEATDERTVVVNLSEPDPGLLSYFAQATGVIGDPETLDEESSTLRPVGSGPYTLADATVDGSEYVLERRDDHWNAEAYPFKTFTVRVIQDRTAAFNALQAGEIDAGRIQPQQRPQVEGAGLTVHEQEAISSLLIILADRGGELAPPLADLRVRQAINMAFDREQFVETLFQGVGAPTVQPFNPSEAAYNEDLEGTYDFDPEAARELLADAGYEDGFSLTMPSTVISQSFEPVVTQALADIGITIQWEPVPPQNTASSLASKQYPAALWFMGLNVPAREVADLYAPTGFLNPFNYEDPELTELFSSIANEADEAAQAELYQELNAFSVENALNAPIAYIGGLWATTEDVDFIPEVSVLPTVRNFGVVEG